MSWLRLRNALTNGDVIVNLDNVTEIRPGETSFQSTVYYLDGSYTEVAETFDSLVQHLFSKP